jgi:hypothetical protein
MSSQEKAVEKFCRRLWLVLILRRSLGLMAAWTCLWGTAVLVLRAAAGSPRLPLLAGLAGLPLCVLAAVHMVRGRLPSRAAVRAMLDRRAGCGGLLMAGAECDLGGWQRELPDLPPPRVSWQSRRSWGLLAAGAGFVLVSFLIPEGLADLMSEPPLEVGREAERLGLWLDVLKETGLLDSTRVESLLEKLEQVRRQASGKDPARALEALDHLENVARRTAREAAEKSAHQNEGLAAAQTLAEALLESGLALDEKHLAEVAAELASLVKQTGLDKELARHIDPELLKACQSRALTDEQMHRLAESLHETRGDLAEKMERLQKAGLIDREALERCQKAGQCNSAALAAYLKKNGNKASLDDVRSLCKKGGQGGTSRGPGAAEMTWEKASPEEKRKFREEVLPPGVVAALKGNRTNGPAKGPPVVTVTDSGGPAQSGALAGAAAGGGSANAPTVLPRHRGTVQRYFDRHADHALPDRSAGAKE